jgi:spore maturation protein SpmB
MNRNLLIAGAACRAAFVLPALLVHGRDPNHGGLPVPLVPDASVGLSRVLLAAIRELFGMFGFSSVVATLGVGLAAIAQYSISAEVGVQGINALCNAVFVCCGAALVLIFGAVWIRSLGQENRWA